MTTNLTPELQKQIEQEAETITAGFKDTNDYEAGIIQGYKEGYEDAGDKYALKLQAAEQQLEKIAKAAEALNNGISKFFKNLSSNNPDAYVINVVQGQRVIERALTEYNKYKALTPKTSSDDTAHG